MRKVSYKTTQSDSYHADLLLCPFFSASLLLFVLGPKSHTTETRAFAPFHRPRAL